MCARTARTADRAVARAVAGIQRSGRRMGQTVIWRLGKAIDADDAPANGSVDQCGPACFDETLYWLFDDG
jgi:hypothetical protein